MDQRLRIAVVLGEEDREDMARFVQALAEVEGVVAWAIELPALESEPADFIVLNLGMGLEARLAALPAALRSRMVPVGIDRAQISAVGQKFAPAAMVEYASWRNWAGRWEAPAAIAIRQEIAAGYRHFADFGGGLVMVGQSGFSLPALLVDCLSRQRRI